MIFKEQTIKNYLEYKHNMFVHSLYQIDNKNIINNINIDCDCEIGYFADMKSTPGYSKFNIREMLYVVQLDFSNLLKYVRKRKLDELN